MVSGFASARLARHESRASTSAVVVPHADGIPAMRPDSASSDTPAGRSPDETVQLIVPTAPDAVGVINRSLPTRADVAGGTVATNGGGSIVSVSVALVEFVE